MDGWNEIMIDRKTDTMDGWMARTINGQNDRMLNRWMDVDETTE